MPNKHRDDCKSWAAKQLGRQTDRSRGCSLCNDMHSLPCSRVCPKLAVSVVPQLLQAPYLLPCEASERDNLSEGTGHVTIQAEQLGAGQRGHVTWNTSISGLMPLTTACVRPMPLTTECLEPGLPLVLHVQHQSFHQTPLGLLSIVFFWVPVLL